MQSGPVFIGPYSRPFSVVNVNTFLMVTEPNVANNTQQHCFEQLRLDGLLTMEIISSSRDMSQNSSKAKHILSRGEKWSVYQCIYRRL